MATYTAEQMAEIGGNRWEGRNGTVRVYLNDWPAMIGLEVTRYRTGNISGASLLDEKISNTRAGRLLDAKVYWENGKIMTNLGAIQDDARVAHGVDLVGILTAEIARRVAELDAAATAETD